MLIFNVSYMTVGFASYLEQMKTAFGVEQWPVTLLIVMPSFLYLPMNFVSAWAFANYRIDRVLQFAALL